MPTKFSTRQQQIISLFLRHPEAFTGIVSKFYAFKADELEKFETQINWDQINYNEAIDWNEGLIRKYSPKLDWYIFSKNSAFADTNLLETFKDQIDWRGEVEDGFFYSVASGKNIIWTSELITKYEDRLNFNYLSMNEQIQWTEQLIDQFKDRWNWDNLMMNHSIPWTLPMLNRFISRIDTSKFHFEAHPVLTSQLDILEAYRGYFLDSAICGNPKLPWKEENLLKRWEDQLDWWSLAGNEALFEDPSFFEDHLDKWLSGPYNNFEMLSKNEALPWSISFIERFSERWDWEYLSCCSYLPWTEELINHFENYWEWGGKYICEITEDEDGNRLPEPFSVYTAYADGLATNPDLPWSIDFILRNEDRLDFDQLAENAGVWKKAIKPYVDEKMVDMIFQLI